MAERLSRKMMLGLSRTCLVSDQAATGPGNHGSTRTLLCLQGAVAERHIELQTASLKSDTAFLHCSGQNAKAAYRSGRTRSN